VLKNHETLIINYSKKCCTDISYYCICISSTTTTFLPTNTNGLSSFENRFMSYLIYINLSAKFYFLLYLKRKTNKFNSISKLKLSYDYVIRKDY
jgi:hypothetical protein